MRHVWEQTMVPTLDGSSSATSGLSEETNDGYFAKAIAEQPSMTGLEIAAMYTRTCVELCIRNWTKWVRALSNIGQGNTCLVAGDDYRARM